MNESGAKPNHKESGLGSAFYLFLGFVFVVLYSLSIGPVRMVYQTMPPEIQQWILPLLKLFYSPLEYLYNEVRWIQEFYDWYLSYWQ